MKIVIGVASHKPYWMPQDPIYLPIQVGKTPCPGWQRDDDGENISHKNATFCELTGLFWLWKHMDADVYGLAHYRRHFAKNRFPFVPKKNRILSAAKIEDYMDAVDVLLPKKRHYWIETNESQYVHAHHPEDLLQTEAILAERYPAYLPAWEKVMKRRSGHRFNMFIMKKKVFCAYCEWLFDVLFELERRLDISDYSDQDRRVFGYVGERLMDVWIETWQLPYRECPVENMEGQHWPRKIWRFLHRKWKKQG